MDSSTTATIQVGAVSIDFLVDATLPVAASRCSSAWSQPMRRCPCLTAMTGSRKRSTASRAPAPGRSTANPGSSAPASRCAFRRGQVHGFENRGGVDAKFLAIATPGVFGPAYFQDIAQVLAGAAGGPPDLAAIAKAMRRHGLTPAQPVAT